MAGPLGMFTVRVTSFLSARHFRSLLYPSPETRRPPRVTFVLPAPGWSAPAYETNEMVRPNPAVGSQARQYGQSETHTVL